MLLSDPAQNYRLGELAGKYDILALRPSNERALQMACASNDCDLISFDLTQRFDYYPKHTTLSSAIERGVLIELCYAPGVVATDTNARRNLIGNATQIIRATRGRGLILSSEAARPAACRAPDDVINLAAVWGLGQERGKEALDKLARAVVVSAQLRRTSYRGAINIVIGGDVAASTLR